MSVKLGNTDIAGTQVLYSTTGSNTDGAMTQAATTTQLSLKANDANVIHNNGDESYTGFKANIITLNLNERNYISCNAIDTNVDATIAQSFAQDLYTDVIRDINYNFLSWNTTNINTDKSVYKKMSARCKNTANTGNVTSNIQVCASPNGSVWATAPASDINGSIVTTVNKSKAAKGGFKLGNGMIVNWGTVSGSGGTVTYSIPFSNTNYGISMTRISANGTNDNDAITAVTSTSFTATVYQGGGARWVAIGY